MSPADGSIIKVPTIFFEGVSIRGGTVLDAKSAPNQGTTDWIYKRKFANDTWKYNKVRATKLPDGSFDLHLPKTTTMLGKGMKVTVGKLTFRIAASDINNGNYARIGDCAVDLRALKKSPPIVTVAQLDQLWKEFAISDKELADLDEEELQALGLEPMTDEEIRKRDGPRPIEPPEDDDLHLYLLDAFDKDPTGFVISYK